jgi:hypothetical protein
VTEKMRVALQVIASWQDVDITTMTSSELRKIIKNMVLVANEALEEFPWEKS